MMGFVAALSSSIAFIILIMSSQLLNVISVQATREKEAQSIQISRQLINILPEQSSATDQYSYYISEEEVAALMIIDKPVSLYCTYGNNFSLEIAKKISAYNFILLKNNQKELNISLLPPELNKRSLQKDSCYLTTE